MRVTKLTIFQEIQYLLDNVVRAHNERVCMWYFDKVGHALNFGFFHADFTVIGIWQAER